MKVDNKTNLAFKTNIRVVSPNKFRRIVDKLCLTGSLKEIVFFDIKSEPDIPKFKAYATKIKNVFTKHIRTCTGVLVADKGKEASLFGHFYNSQENIRDSKILEPYMEGTNAILIVSKRHFYYSNDVFNTFRDKIRKRKIPITILKSLNINYEANMAYTADNDELILCVKNTFNPKEYARDMRDLKKIFRHVKISSADTLEFDTKPKATFWENFKAKFKR